MKSANAARRWSARQGGLRQRGQALVYGLFVLASGLAALFFLFNAGQLTHERDKLTTTADAVAYSAGVMNARALNFTAYTNRALMANEVAVAQMVSIASWTRYTAQHGETAASLGCETYYNWPLVMSFGRYTPLCMGLYWAASYTDSISDWLDDVAPTLIYTIEGVKAMLQGAQLAMAGLMISQRPAVMREVAEANFRGNGAVKVELPLEDDFLMFDGAGPFLNWRTGNARDRMASAAVAAAYQDPFVQRRTWSDPQKLVHPCGLGLKSDRIDRSGGTSLVGLDQWKAADKASYTQYYTRVRWSGISCRSRTNTLASGQQSAGDNSGSSTNWSAYQGIPSFLDLSDRALSYTPENSHAAKRDPRLRFTARLTRTIDQTMTSEGRSAIRSSPDGGVHGLNQFKSDAARNQLGAVATAEVYFERPTGRADGKKELANVFNPYWQVHLVETSSGVKAAARALQGVLF